ncbi:hypothetical protein ACIQVT_01600 [Streptomyces sp. NPDC100445]|uniref:hypothetical protein n=1 Tax=Streptomyces sp. NPDC100445 TaxID=3366102 RepID=UPI0038175A88
MSPKAFTTAATNLLEHEDVEAVTPRGLAREAQTGAASLCPYVRTVHELHAILPYRVLTSVDPRAHLADHPRERPEAVCSSYLNVLPRHAGLARPAAGVLPYGYGAIARTDT